MRKRVIIKKESNDLQSGDIRKIEHMLKLRVGGPGGQDDKYHPFTLSQLKNFELALRQYNVKKGGMKHE